MDNDSLPPGVTRGPYRGTSQPKASHLLWVSPALIVLVWTMLTLNRWIEHGDGWTLVHAAVLLTCLVALVAGVREFRRRRQLAEPGPARR
jgi:lysylphosphatidylglycerol synthetase-like protein (DUF2156 family)